MLFSCKTISILPIFKEIEKIIFHFYKFSEKLNFTSKFLIFCFENFMKLRQQLLNYKISIFIVIFWKMPELIFNKCSIK